MAGSILISGAGIAGPALAYWLLQAGFTPTLIERAPHFREGGYMIDFWGEGYDVAEKMNLLPRLHEVGYMFNRIKFVDENGCSTESRQPFAKRVAVRHVWLDGPRYFSLAGRDS